MIEDKIKEAREEIEREEKRIIDAQASIAEKIKDIEELNVLEKRMLRIFHVKFQNNLGSMLQISTLGNKYTLGELLGTVAKLSDTNLSYSAEMAPLMRLTIWQAMFVLLSDDAGHEGEGPDKAE